MKTKSTIFSLLFFVFLFSSPVFAIDWSAYTFIGADTGGETYNNKFKVATVEGQNLGSIQNFQSAGWGIYTSFGSGIQSVSGVTKYKTEGAGVCLHCSSFTFKETEVTVTCAQATYTFTVYYEDGVESSEDDTEYIFFVNYDDTATPTAYMWKDGGSATNDTYPGVKMEDTGIDNCEGKRVWRTPYSSQWDKIIINNGQDGDGNKVINDWGISANQYITKSGGSWHLADPKHNYLNADFTAWNSNNSDYEMQWDGVSPVVTFTKYFDYNFNSNNGWKFYYSNGGTTNYRSNGGTVDKNTNTWGDTNSENNTSFKTENWGAGYYTFHYDISAYRFKVTYDNLAWNKTYSTQNGTPNNQANGNNGNNNDQWEWNACANVTNPSYTIDLGAQYILNTLRLTWLDNSGAWLKKWTYQVSTDNSNWTTVKYETRSTTPSNKEVTETSVNCVARYIRIVPNTFAAQNWYMREFEVYGNPVDATDNVAPTAVTASVTNINAYNDIEVELTATDNIGANMFLFVESTTGERFTASTNASNIANLNMLSHGTRYNFNVYAIDNAGNVSSAYTTLQVDVPVDPTVNIALKKPTYSSKGENGSTTSTANDGLLTTNWERNKTPLNAEDEYIYFDLGAYYKIGSVVISWQTYAKSFTIDLSADATTWTTIHTVSGQTPNTGNDANRSKINTYTITGTNANQVGRYIRLNPTGDWQDANNWRLYEVEVYGSEIVFDYTPPVICSGTSKQQGDGGNATLTDGYNLSFEYSSGTKELTVTIEVLDNLDGLAAPTLYKETNVGLGGMEAVVGATRTWSKTLTDIEPNSTATYYVHAAAANGIVLVTKHITITTGGECPEIDDPAVPDAPTTVPALPTEISSLESCQVIGIYGMPAQFTDKGFTALQSWGRASATYTTITGRNVLQQTNSTTSPDQFAAIDITDFDKIHFDIWTKDAENLELIMLPDGYHETDYQRVQFSTNAAEWTSVTLDLNSFLKAGSTDEVIKRFYETMVIFYVYNLTNTKTYYFTNICFYRTTACPVNLALNKTAYAGWSRTVEQPNAGEVPTKANDGNYSDQSEYRAWGIGTKYPDNAWWGVELDNNYKIKEIRIFWNGDGQAPRTYDIQASTLEPSDFSNDHIMDDNTNWHTIKTITNQEQNLNGAVNKIQFTEAENITGRYIRLVNKDAERKEMYLKEFEVYGYGIASCTSVNTPNASFKGIENGQIKLELTATDANSNAITDFAVLYNGVYYDVTTDASNIGYLTLPSARNITVQVYSYNECKQRSEGYVTLNIGDYLNPTENLALKKDCWASGTANQDGELKENANDGYIDNNKSKYFWGAGDNAWWIVDLGELYKLSSIECFFTTDKKPTAYKLYGMQSTPTEAQRSTNESWVELANITSGINAGTTEANKNEHAITYTSAIRYVKYYGTEAEVKLLEFRVFGSAFAEADNTAPTITKCEMDASADNYTSTVLHIEATDDVDGEIYNFEISIDGGTTWTTYTANTTTHLVTVTGLTTNGNYTIKVRTHDNAGNVSETKEIIVHVFNIYENLALNKSSEAGFKNDNAGEQPKHANDGQLNTHWITNGNNDYDLDWWYVDLGALYQLREIAVYFENASYATDYLIQVREVAPTNEEKANDKAWSTVEHSFGTPNTNNAQLSDGNHIPTNAVAQYVRFKALKTSAYPSAEVKLKEIMVYGTDFVTSNTDNKPTMTNASVVSQTIINDGSHTYYTLVAELTAKDVEDGDVHRYELSDPEGNVWQVTTGNDNQASIKIKIDNTRYEITVRAVDNDGNRSDESKTIQVGIVDPTVNLAYLKPSYAGIQENDAHNAAKANDGYTIDDKGWFTGVTRDLTEEQRKKVWWYVDLQDVYVLDHIEAFYETACSDDFVFQTRQVAPKNADLDDDAAWTTIYTNHNVTPSNGTGEGNKNTYNIEGQTARYVRFKSYHEYDNGAYGHKTWEFRIYGSNFATADEEAPNLTKADLVATDATARTAVIEVAATDDVDNPVVYYTVTNTDTGESIGFVDDGTHKLTLTNLNYCVDYNFSVTARDAASNVSSSRTVEVTISPLTTANIALNKPTYANNSGNASKGNAVDNDENSAWDVGTGLQDSEDRWITVDLGGLYDLDNLEIKWGKVDNVEDVRTHPHEWYMKGSVNGSVYYIFDHKASRTPDGETYTWTSETDVPMPARYVQMLVLRPGEYTSIRDLQVYPKAQCFSEQPVITWGEITTLNPISVELFCDAYAEGKQHNEIQYYYVLTNTDNNAETTATVSHNNGAFTIDNLTKGANYNLKVYASVDGTHSANYKEFIFNVEYSSLHYLTEETDCNWTDGLYKTEWQFAYTDNYAPTEKDGNNQPLQILSYINHTITQVNSITPPSVQWKLYEAAYGGVWTGVQGNGNLFFRDPEGKHLIMYALGTEQFVSNLHDLYVSGDAVGSWWTADNAPNSTAAQQYLMKYDEETGLFSWTGDVTPGVYKYFKIYVRDIYSANDESSDQWNADRIMKQNQTYDRDWTRATLHFDMKTWTWWWENAMDGCTREGDEGSGSSDNDGQKFTTGYKVDTYTDDTHLIVEAECFDEGANNNAILQVYADEGQSVKEFTDKETKTYSVAGVTHTYYKFTVALDNADLMAQAILNTIRYCVKFEGEAGAIRITEYHYYDIANKQCAPDFFVIYHTGDKPQEGDVFEPTTGDIEAVENTVTKIIQPIEYRIKCKVGRWQPVYLPFGEGNGVEVKVYNEVDGKYYPIYPRYRKTEGSTKVTGGNYYLHYIDNTQNETTVADFKEAWVSPVNNKEYTPSPNKPYNFMVEFDYYEGRYISFFSKKGYIDVQSTFSLGEAPNEVGDDGTKVRVYGNNTLMPHTFTEQVYLTNYESYDGWAWTRYDDGTVYPFETYIRADQQTTQLYRILSREGYTGGNENETPTSYEQVMDLDETQADITVYSVAGQLLYRYTGCSVREAAREWSEQAQQGLYLLRAGAETVKVMVTK